MLVRHPQHPEWGTGQVQSCINGKITVNFEEVGKVVINGVHIDLVLLSLGVESQDSTT
jgi:hypothetical protein